MLNERLVFLRKKRKLSQYEVADKLGYSRGKIANYEQGSRQPDYETLKILANFYDVTVDYLLGRSDDPSANNDKVVVKGKEIIDFLNDREVTYKGSSLTNEDKEKVIEMLKIMLKKDTD